MFEAGAYNASVADDASLDLLIIPANSCHLRLSASAGGDAELELYENTEVVVTSPIQNQIVAKNRNRNIVKVASTIFISPPTFASPTNLGERLSGPAFVIGGSGVLGGTPGGTSGYFEEWILKAGLNYLVRLTNRAGTNQPGYIECDFYEPHLGRL